ncbi:MAG: hypothetical protein QM793_14655 [Muricomes sp.]
MWRTSRDSFGATPDPEHRERNRRRRVERAHLEERDPLREERVRRRGLLATGIVLGARRIGAHALEDHEDDVARGHVRALNPSHRQALSRARPELMTLLGESREGAHHASHRVHVEHVRCRGLSLAMTERQKQAQRKDGKEGQPQDRTAPLARREELSRSENERASEEEERQFLAKVVRKVGEELIQDAVAEVGREAGNIHVQVSVELLEEIRLAPERNREEEEKRADRDLPESSARRRCGEERRPNDGPFNHAQPVEEPFLRREFTEARSAQGEVEENRAKSG